MYNPLLLVLLTYPLHASSFTFSTRESQEKVPTAIEVAADMYPGWNLGNTIEPRPSYRTPVPGGSPARNHATPILLLQSPSTSIHPAYQYNVMPQDNTPHAIMLEVHYYPPYNFTTVPEGSPEGSLLSEVPKKGFYIINGNKNIVR